MGWWPFSPETRADAIRSGDAIPTRNERQICWAARDAYFNCLDANNVIDATKEPGISTARKACAPQSAEFEKDCAAAWVKYFKQWRVADIQKKRRLEELQKQGAVEMSVSTSFAPEGGAAQKGTSKEDIQAMLEKRKSG